MKPASRAVLALCAVLALASTLVPAVCAGEDPPAERRRRWGFGWDSGIAARYYVTPNWGLGLRVNPNIRDEEVDGDEVSSHVSEYTPFRDRTEESTSRIEEVNWGVGIMAFREFDVYQRFRLGPYGGVSYSYASYTWARSRAGEHSEPSGMTRIVESELHSSITRSVTALAGIRPVARIGKRVLLETRFGVAVAFSNRDENHSRRRYESTDDDLHLDESSSHDDTEGWRVYTIGSDEILYTDVQIIFMF